MDWTEIAITVPTARLEAAGSIAHMVVPYGIYIEDYSNLEAETWEIAHIDLIDAELLKKDRTNGIIHIFIAPQERPQEALQFLETRFIAENIPYEIRVTACKNADWENNWKQYFKPLPVGEKLLIRPTWEEEYDAKGRLVLHLEPGLAFGTGSHATTRLCLEALERHVQAGSTLLDIGCGSGILAIAALLLGAKTAVGIDIDALAVKTAKENAAVNGFGPEQIQLLHGDVDTLVQGQFAVVAANIVADVIVQLSPIIPRFLQADGVFIASGLIEQRVPEVELALQDAGLMVTGRFESEGWVCLEMKRE